MPLITKYSLKIFVEGIDMLCPLCKELIVSGDTHECSSEQAPKKKEAVKRGR